MFNTEAIICSENDVWTARACCPTVQKAESVRAGCIGPVRQINMFADLYREGKDLVIEGPDRETVEKIADILNHAAWDQKD